MEGREVRVHRTVSFVERGAVPQEFNRSFNDHQWFDAPQNYKDTREYHNKSYPCRDFPQPQHLGPYNQRGYKRRDLRHQLRNRRRPGASSLSHGQELCPPQRTMPDAKSKSQHSSLGHREDRWTPLPVAGRGHSPGSTETQSPVRSGSNTSSKSFSPDRDTGSPHQPALKKYKPNVPGSHSPCSLVEEQPSSKEKTPASVAETEEVVAAGMEPELTPEEDFKARRLNAIKAKALEIEKHFRQDCETFCTVVKMLVAKEPTLENLLQSSLDKNLLDIKQHCLDDLRHFMKELDEAIAQGRDMPNQDSHNISSKLKEEDPHLCSTSPTSTDVKHEERSQPRNTEDFSHYTAVDHGVGKHTGKETTLVPEIHKPGRQENLATPVAENSHSNPVKLLPHSPSSSAQQVYSKDHHERLQLCGCLGEKLSNADLSNHRMWQNISYIRPGWVPDGPPFLPDDQYWELKANSTVVSISIPPCLKDPRQDMVACGVTRYIHDNSPWCEVQNDHGTRVCLLVADPETPQIPALMQF